MLIGTDLHRNDAFRLSHAFEYAYLTGPSKENSDFRFTPSDTYEWYLRVGPLRNIQVNKLQDTVDLQVLPQLLTDPAQYR